MHHHNNDTTTKRPGYWLRAIEHSKRRMTREYRKGLGTVAREGITDEDYATTMATLETMARNLGWDESHADEHPWRGRGKGLRRHFGGPHPFAL